jgi:DNA-binding NarL/FixJ family response regulator
MESENIIHIAFADDHDTVRESLIYLLNDLGGISVDIEAGDGLELLEKLKAAERLPDICMIDIRMPNMDGYDVLIQIREQWPDMKVLVLTGFDEQPMIIKMIMAGANGYLLKSNKPQVIKEALQSIRATGYFYSEQAPSTIYHLVENKAIKPVHFSDAEIDFIKHSCIDLQYNQIAAKMNISIRKVEGLRDRVTEKLNVTTRVGIVMYAIQSGLVPVEIDLLTAEKNKKN